MGDEPAKTGEATDDNAAPKSLKLVLLGSGGIGKSSLVVRFIKDSFDPKYDPSIEDRYRKQINYDGKTYILDIIDTAGQEEYAAALRHEWIREGEVFIMTYGVDNTRSFAEMQEVLEEVRAMKSKPAFVICSAKSDLDHTVKEEDAKELAEKLGCKFVATSAKSGKGVQEAFESCIVAAASVIADDQNGTGRKGVLGKKRMCEQCAVQ